MQLCLIFTLCVLPVCLKAGLNWQVKRATGGSEPKLVIYSLLSQSNCSPEFELFDYKTSISNAVWYVYNKTLRSDPQFTVMLGFGEAPYCTIEQEDRAVNLTSELLLLSEQTEMLDGFAVYLGPPDGTDCNIVNDWISLSKPGSRASSRLFQINYLCRLQGFTSVFVLNDLDPATQKPVASETLAAVSLTIDLSTLISTVRVLLQTEGWEHFAIVHEVSQKQNKNAAVAQSMARTLTTENGNFVLTGKRSIHPGMNLTKLMQMIPESTDVIILLTRPPLAMQFMEQNANVTRITQGRLALLHVDYTDMLTYDVLRFWRQSLQNCQPLGEPSRSLLILTALPRGTVYSENLNFFNEKTNMAASAGAGLAVRLMQLNIKNHGGRVDQNVGLFLPLVTSDVNVPINSNITFQFQQYDVNSVRGMYDIYIFSFSLEASTPAADLTNMTYTELFTLNDIILWPIIAVQQIQSKVWPGSGRGPPKTACLLYKCQAGRGCILWGLVFSCSESDLQNIV
ncbi:unnamed protein product [Dibothriocephalus latus]|uniref:Receptor ligand binding region domain-containing protein n=1 Tax=Dibothriocephalus latus TaxID=60516 RepID=A0A3P6SKB2_DIBLA|nr:unnamed protein product [Dibothriocephalus latus]